MSRDAPGDAYRWANRLPWSPPHVTLEDPGEEVKDGPVNAKLTLGNLFRLRHHVGGMGAAGGVPLGAVGHAWTWDAAT
jgi:hypothetical protein